MSGRPWVCPSVRGSVRGSVSIKEKRGLGASNVGYPALFDGTRQQVFFLRAKETALKENEIVPSENVTDIL